MADKNETPKFILIMRELDTTLMMLCAFALAMWILLHFKEAIIADGASGIIGIAGAVIGYCGNMIQSAWQNGNDRKKNEDNDQKKH